MGTTTPTGKIDTTTGTAAPSKTVTTTPSAGIVQGPGNEKPKDCATGWEEAKPTRKLRDSAMTGRELDEKQQTKRKLEANSNKDIAKLEAYFGTSMEMTLKNLPTEGDSINVQWSEGEASPAEKYAKAFGLDVKEFMDKVSKDNGIDSMSKRPKCTSDNDCASLNDGSGCGIRAGQSSGYCIPTWYGICHAWTPASMLEAEPNCPVTHNGVTFHPMDLKALISDIYDGASISTVFTGSRFNGGSDSTDEYGRHSSAAYRDLNPAFFHITAANLLGKLNATFIADVTAGSEVWNQPVRGFKVYEQTEMSLEEAAQTFYGLEEYPWNAAAKSIVYVKSRLSWIFETYTDGGLVSSGQVDQFTTGAYYTYLLEMDDDGTIIGGEWVYNSDNDHPDFIWFPKEKPAADTVTSIGLSYADVSMLLAKSVACSDSASASGSAGSAGSSPASTTSSTAASTSGSATSSVSSTTGSTTEAPTTSTTGSSAGSNAVTPTGTPAATYASTGSSAVTTAPASSNQGGHQRNHGDDQHQGDDSDDHYRQQQQQQEGQGQRQSYQSYFHWW
ncbi:Alpha-tubulin N-acetyltransferase [Phytophthora nicotianae]|uniref:Alpha-tubulin N-acetyltransferase n=1 Tax=Phytophthora nicotianae TaxID=4792 RepID=A0A0W8CQ88_PHYNI|nr:Alpha-tubulin N-acetyltransferase [Phytophthora nicotianae]